MRIFLKWLLFLTIFWKNVTGQSKTRRDYQWTPKITQTPEVFLTNPARDSNFAIPCTAEAIPPADIEWRFNGGVIDRNRNSGQPFRPMIDGRLFFRNVGRLEVGYYECRAWNSLGEDKVTHTLVLYDYIPSDDNITDGVQSITPFTVVATSETTITIRRTNLSAEDPFDIYYFPDAGNDVKRRIKVSPSMIEYTLDKLHCFTEYKLSPFHDMTHVFYVRTKGLSLPPPLMDKFISVGRKNVTMNLTTWHEGNCPEWKFTIKYIPTILKGFGDWITKENVSPSENYTITDLVPGTNYTFEIYSNGYSSMGAVQVYKIQTLMLNENGVSKTALSPEIHLPDNTVNFNTIRGSDDFHFSVTCWVPTNSEVYWLNSKGEKIEEILKTSSRIYQQIRQGKLFSATKLYIDKVTEKDFGSYSCHDPQSGLKTSFTFKVQVDDAKKENTTHVEKSAYEGTEYCMTCPSASDSSKEHSSTINWKVNGFKPLPPKYIVDMNFKLCIQNVTKDDSKQKYSCNSDSIYDKQEKNIHLNVLIQPWLSDLMETKIFSVFGTLINITCSARDANPPAKFEWLKETQLLTSSHHEHSIWEMEENISVLQIMFTNQTSPGPYTCQAQNSVGIAEMQFSLHQAQKPPPPMLHLIMTAFDGVRVQTKDELTKDASPIVGYVVQTKLIDTTKEEEPWTVATVSKTEDGFMVRNLMSETKYLVRAASQNSAKLVGDYSLPIAVNTDSIKEHSLPIQFKDLFAFTSDTDSHIYVNLGEWVNLTCIVFADPQAVLHWRKDNKTVEKNYAVQKLYPRINMAILRIFMKHQKNFGDYSCSATRQNVEDLIEWTISVHPRTPLLANQLITLIPQVKDVTLFQDSSYFVSCQTPNGTTDLEWIDNNNRQIRNYNTASPIHIVNYEGVGVDLVFNSVQINDTGNYTCIGPQNSTRTAFHLQVIEELEMRADYQK